MPQLHPNIIIEVGEINDCILGEYTPARAAVKGGTFLMANVCNPMIEGVPDIRINLSACVLDSLTNGVVRTLTLTLLHELCHWATELNTTPRIDKIDEYTIDEYLESIIG